MIAMEEARSILSPYSAELYRCVANSWEKWLEVGGETFDLPLARTRANVVSNLMNDEARKRLCMRDGIQVTESAGRSLFEVDGRLLLHFKKLNSGLRTSNYPTQQALLFARQLTLPSMPELPRLTVGYRLDRAAQFVGVFVVFLVGKALRWSYQIEQPAVEIVENDFNVKQNKNQRRVRVKPAAESSELEQA